MRLTALLPGQDMEHLDHLAPLCSLLDIPLLVTDEEIEELARVYYPDLKLLFYSPLEMPHALTRDFDTAITCLPRALIDELLFAAQGRRIRTIWCPHGNSDKGWTIPFMEGLKQEETLLVYGERMRTFLRVKGIHAPTISVGNYRFEYYKRHRHFYDALLEVHPETTLLYAPTWQDQERSSSFEEAHPFLIEGLRADQRLIIKPHPHLKLQYPHLIEKIGPHLLDTFPPIYPLLNQTDVYIGDMSSIGYDFLAFNRPLILLNPNRRNPKTDPGLSLSRGGPILTPEEYSHIYSHIDQLLEKDPYSKRREQLYQETFDSCKLALHELRRH